MIPKVGDHIYVETELYLSHGEDDFHGGLCEVTEVKELIDKAGNLDHLVTVKENPSAQYKWEGYLQPLQEKLREKYGSQRGHPIPDHRPEFNT